MGLVLEPQPGQHDVGDQKVRCQDNAEGKCITGQRPFCLQQVGD